ncbi:2Fe-2S iron-sulfur cluster-binding protein [Marinobacter sp. DY40_1A1]|uniref:2Fe-2S iron-sulfur cluster-binding protein n=1 Tax=Marinobacter sp. DY40_1A1 TaxID=2583229 RepID=UPI001907E5CA|nr:2Fe-2S iron-sulfur cluster-binding protein [Marinobacter sp. DY40_1A1]MBK1887120.1 2Fe-2S iron-sulfur cluster binding domain-containing protein [Marinobacter sp. DY40_1A1]
MGSITFIEHDGAEHAVEIETGKSLMQIAMNNGVPGIDADCGGEAACGTCHVIVDGDWIAATGKAGDEELQMLDMTPDRAPTSRLACQIIATDAMDGLVARLPEFQM